MQRNSATEVFGIPELCGLILDYLTHEDIFQLQNLTKACRVHLRNFKPWQKSILHQATVESFTVKPTLQGQSGKLVTWVFSSGPSSGESFEAEQRRTDMPISPAISAPPRFGLGVTVPRSPSQAQRDYQMQNVKLNWLLTQRFPKFSYYPSSNMLGFEEEIPMGDYFTNSDASYRPLLLTSPPLSEVTVMDPRGKVYEAANSKGVTMGDIVDVTLEALL
jgi:hypothetical protein